MIGQVKQQYEIVLSRDGVPICPNDHFSGQQCVKHWRIHGMLVELVGALEKHAMTEIQRFELLDPREDFKVGYPLVI